MKFYVDTSVWGGYFDDEFKEWTIPFIEQIKAGKCTAILSNITLGEVAPIHRDSKKCSEFSRKHTCKLFGICPPY